MTIDQLCNMRLNRQHLLQSTDALTVVQDLCGLQAQYLVHALHALSLRANPVTTDGLIKSWTIRGTMHIFAKEDLPLFLHENRKHFLRPVDTMESDGSVSSGRKAYFADLVIDAISGGTDSRESLKDVCRSKGMTEGEEASLFDPWGGLIRALCESGKICHKVQAQKAYQLCPDFVPMDPNRAELELATRYFTHYGPATVKDAAYFFGTTQAQVKSWLKNLPVQATDADGRTFYYIGETSIQDAEPKCFFLAGFDPMIVGNDKSESLSLSRTHLRDIFTLSGIIRPTVLLDGRIAGWWNQKNHIVTVRSFNDFDSSRIRREAETAFSDAKKIIID